MKGLLDRTKVVLRHLPPTISQSNLEEHIDSRFSGRYHWLAFRSGKSSPNHLKCARAYIDFNKPEDVIEFAEFFKGHVFVNEKGAQYRTSIEYAPSQRIPNQWSKKDGRQETILKDPEYLEFLEFLAKPVENLPSAEIQLERKEAERAGAPKDAPIVTPLMDYVRRKRAAKGGSRRSVLNGKPARRVGGVSSRNPVSKRGSEKRTSATMYVLRESSKILSNKDKSPYLSVPKQDDLQLRHISINSASISGNQGENGGTGSTGTGKKKILLLKGKEKEIPNNQQHEASGRIIRSILLSRDTRQNQPSEVRIQERDKKSPRSPSLQSFQKDTNGTPLQDNDLHAVPTEKQERRMRNKGRPDCGLWGPVRHSDGLHSSDESLMSSASKASQMADFAEGTYVEAKEDMMVVRGGEYRPLGVGRGRHYTDNGPYRHGGRRGPAYNMKDADGPSIVEGKSSKRGGSSGYVSHEKQVWVQKSSSAT